MLGTLGGRSVLLRSLLVCAAALLYGCATPISTGARPEGYYSSPPQDQGASLFSGDAAVLSSDAINRILDYRYEPPALSRIALMPFGREMWSGWSEELAVANEGLKRHVISQLTSSPHVYEASYLPSILVPEKHSVPYLREAAARYQAVLLLIYRTYCRSFDRYRFITADETKAFCGVEAALLDTRTGLVPFTSVTTQSFQAKKEKGDLSFQETVLKAQLEAVTKALEDVSSELVRFLGRGHGEGA